MLDMPTHPADRRAIIVKVFSMLVREKVRLAPRTETYFEISEMSEYEGLPSHMAIRRIFS